METIEQLAPLLKLIAEVGIGVFMAVVVAGSFIWVLRYTIPQIAAVHAQSLSELTESHRQEREEWRRQHEQERSNIVNSFLESLKTQREHNREVTEQVSEKIDDACKYRPRGHGGSVASPDGSPRS